MEQNVQVIAKRVWHIMRVAYFMLRKNISKRKLLLDLKYKYLAMKRPKLAGKSLVGKLTHYHHHHNHHAPSGAYEFSCSNTPNHHNFFPSFHHHVNKNTKSGSKCKSHAPINEMEEREIDAVKRVLEMMVSQNDDVESISPYSPVLPGFGFGHSPAVRQLRITDSPYYPIDQCVDDELVGDQMGNYKVDEAAEEFIKRFYTQLSQQRITDA